jgi:hypothetical protein
MTTQPGTDIRKFFIDKTRIREILTEQAKKDGRLLEPTMTPQELRARMIAMGVRPEDNIFSCGIIAARDEE